MKATVYDRRFFLRQRGKKGSEATKWLRFPCFHPVNLSAVQDGVEVLLRIRDGLEVIGVYQAF